MCYAAAAVTGFLIFILMLLFVADVTGRYIFNALIFSMTYQKFFRRLKELPPPMLFSFVAFLYRNEIRLRVQSGAPYIQRRPWRKYAKSMAYATKPSPLKMVPFSISGQP